MVRIWTTIMIVLILLLRIGPNKPSLSGRQAPAQAQTSDLVPSLFPLGLWAPGFCTWSSPDEDKVWRPAWEQGPKGEPDPRGLRPRKPVPGTGNRDSGTRRRLQDATEQDPRPGNDVASAETAGPPSPSGIRAQDRAPRHRRAPPARMPVAPAPSADGEPLQEQGGGLFHRTRSVYNGLELNTWMKVERLFVEKFHQSFSLDN
ncbi:sphingosine-1-phosphate receptor 3 [Homo sapiens]|nr:RecName: Full=Uncharacterized protein C9orf47; Flags: Precursor [Homo sapiens]KAI2553067.1 sphingosine-1-phosphate receptor 3 [Homo sapiens]KAI4007595.1 sphingosine-1-phosphate receptor 3 [Homo sapiens]BAC87162.1 unnamed protein product [Homo sapiens]|eukprot:NP_001001938.1 uncharacterized protein C9orf47 isoform 1 precursor [Homo sapiens]